MFDAYVHQVLLIKTTTRYSGAPCLCISVSLLGPNFSGVKNASVLFCCLCANTSACSAVCIFCTLRLTDICAFYFFRDPLGHVRLCWNMETPK